MDLSIKDEDKIRQNQTFVVAPNSVMFDHADDTLKNAFEGIDLRSVISLTLSGNSYSFDACLWIAQNILSHAECLKKLNFSDIFTTRLRNTLPASL